jgi:hypothetical protein
VGDCLSRLVLLRLSLVDIGFPTHNGNAHALPSPKCFAFFLWKETQQPIEMQQTSNPDFTEPMAKRRFSWHTAVDQGEKSRLRL